jgi:hypothetical protein
MQKLRIVLLQDWGNGQGLYGTLNENDDCIQEHFCSNEDFARGDLGFYPEYDPFKRREKYKSLYPNGFYVEFVGNNIDEARRE